MKEKLGYQINVKDVKKAVKAFNDRQELIKKATQDIENPGYDVLGNKYDLRDLVEIISFMPIVGKTEEEKVKCIQNNFKDMVTAFVSADQDSKGVYLEYLYSNYDKMIDYYKNGINTEEDFVNFQCLFSADQTMQTKRRENPDLFYKHYNSEQKLKRYVTTGFLFQTTTTEIARLKAENPELQCKSMIPYEDCLETFKKERQFADSAVDAYENKTDVLEIDDTSAFLASIDAKPGKVREAMTIATIVNGNNFTNDILCNELDAGTQDISYELTFLDGKSLADLAKAEAGDKYKDLSALDQRFMFKQHCLKMLQTAIAKGDKVVTMASPIRVNGKLEFKLTKLKPNVKPQEAAERAKHSAFRLRFFNWGPFRIKPSQDYIDSKVKSKEHDAEILAQAEKRFDEIVKKGQEIQSKKEKPSVDFAKDLANAYLQKETMKDLGKDTSLEPAGVEKQEKSAFKVKEPQKEVSNPTVKAE